MDENRTKMNINGVCKKCGHKGQIRIEIVTSSKDQLKIEG